MSGMFYCFSCTLHRPIADKVRKGKHIQCKHCKEVKRLGREKVKQRLIDEGKANGR